MSTPHKVTFGIRWKLMLPMIGLFLGLLPVLTWMQVRAQRETLELELEKRIDLMRQVLEVRGGTLANQLARQAENDLASFNFSNIEEILAGAARNNPSINYGIVTAVFADTNTIAHVLRGGEKLTPENFPPLDAHARSAMGLTVAASRQLDHGPGSVLEFVEPLIVGREHKGCLRLALSLASLLEETARGRAEMDRQAGTQVIHGVTTAVIALLLASVLVALVTTRISRPIQRLTDSARRLSAGDFSVAGQTAIDSRDEVGLLAGAFSQMAENLKDTYAQLEDYNRTLEEKVADRTRELEHMTAEAESARTAAEEANSTKSAFLASMSHELRTPLTAIIGFAEFLHEEAEDEDREDEAADLQRILDSAKHLLGLINEILDLSKIEARKMELHLERFEVANIIREASNTLAPLVAKKGNELVIEAPEQLGSMNADLVKIRQSLFNLLSNANKFTDQGRVTLHVERFPLNGHDHLRFAVTDTGIGMTEEQVGRLFQAFQQADSSTSRKYGGTGLGLVITKKFCELMGGSIRATSIPGEGSTFTMVIPAEVSEAPAKPPSTRHQENPEILLLTNDDDVKSTVIQALSEVDHKLHVAGNNETGIETAERLTPDLIALDVGAKGGKGWAVMSQLKTDPRLSGIPVVLLTLKDSDVEAGLTIGAADFLAKPIDTPSFQKTLARHLPRPGEGQILLVEDDPNLRDIMSRTIAEQGYQVIVAENGKRALDLLAKHSPQLILLDIMMPVMDGFQFLHQLRRHPEWNPLPIVVLTAKTLTAEEREFLMAHTENVIQKRDRLRDDLLASIRRHCQPAPNAPTQKS